MKYLVPLYAWKRGYCQCEESLILLHFDPARKPVKTWFERLVEIWRKA